MKRHLHIAMLCPGYPASAEDYRGPFVKTLVERLKSRGHRVTVVTPQVFRSNPRYLKVDELEQIYRFAYWTEGKTLPEYRKKPYARLVTYFFSGLYNSVKIIKKENCDLIHAQFLIPTGLMAALIGQLTKRPLVLTVHGQEALMALESGILKRLARWTFDRVAFTVTVAEHTTRKCELLGMKTDRFSKIPMGIDENIFPRLGEAVVASARKKLIVSTRSFIEVDYNQTQLIEALPKIFRGDKEARCVLAGDGPGRPPLEKRVKELGIADRVAFLGKQPSGRIAELLKEAMVYVSTSRFDGASVSLFEAMACGTFPVVTDIEANREWINHGENGYLVELENSKDLAEKILAALGDSALREKAAANNKKLVEDKVLWSKSIARIEDIYRRVLSEAGGS